MKARATSFETASEDLLPKSTLRWEYDREVLRARCASFFCMPSASRKLGKKKTKPSATVSHCGGSTWNTVSRLDLSDLCYVDDLVSLLIFWRKSQLSRFAVTVS